MINRKLTAFDIIAIISAIGTICWVISDFYHGGMVIYLFTYWWLLLPVIILYGISFVETLVSLFRKKFAYNRIKLAAHGAVLLIIIFSGIFQSELFKSKIVITAVLYDDLYQYKLLLRESGSAENQVNGPFGFSTTYYGNYTIKDSLIIFGKVPYDNDFIPDTLLLDKKQKSIFMLRDKHGNFTREKDFANYFEIE